MVEEKTSTSHGGPFMTPIIWPMVYIAIFIHSGFIYAITLMMSGKVQLYSYFWCKKFKFERSQNFKWNNFLFKVFFLIASSIIGVTAGSHRLYSHRSYKVTTSMKYFMLLLISISGQVNLSKLSVGSH